jgi:hypothetical protein
MFGLFLTITILSAVVFNPCIDNQVKSTNCTLINVTVENYYKGFEMIYKYNLLIKAENTFLQIKKIGDYKSHLINSTIPCYIVDNKILFSCPLYMDKYKCSESVYFMKFLLILMGLFFEFMYYHNLSF